MKAVLGIVGAIILVVAGFFGYQYWKLQQEAVKWESAEEIVSEEITKEDQTWKIHMKAVVDYPPDQVWQAVTQPERLSERIDAFKKSELKEETENTKTVELAVQLLTLPLQTMVGKFHYDKENLHIRFETLKSPTQEVQSTYQLTPSPDGTKTLVEYHSTARQKVTVPLPENVQKGALRELFVKTIRAIEKGIAEAETESKKAA